MNAKVKLVLNFVIDNESHIFATHEPYNVAVSLARSRAELSDSREVHRYE